MALGTNLGDLEDNLNQALARMEAYGEDITLEAMSSTYLTEPQGLVTNQPWFMNQVAWYKVDKEIWSPEGFLSALLAIEDQMARERGEPGGPRIIDLDLLLFDNLEQTTGFLDLPHPRMRERAFVLVPLLEIAPDLVLPDGTSAQDALDKLEYQLEDGRITQKSGSVSSIA
ncbi:MAG: 2-amino-4-hydroxy-6-hydroxymethyldihydropteridine diphosphokinase [Desulfovibrio sp.]